MLVIDEYPLLSDRAKGLAVQLLRVGRKARVSIVLASHEATTDALGAAIASSVVVEAFPAGAGSAVLSRRHTVIERFTNHAAAPLDSGAVVLVLGVDLL